MTLNEIFILFQINLIKFIRFQLFVRFLLLIFVDFWSLGLDFGFIVLSHHQIFKLRLKICILILKLWKWFYLSMHIYFWILNFLNVGILDCLCGLWWWFLVLFVEENSLANAISHALLLFSFLHDIFLYFRWTVKSFLFLLNCAVHLW